MAEKKYYTIEEAATYLGITPVAFPSLTRMASTVVHPCSAHCSAAISKILWAMEDSCMTSPVRKSA